ncbi:hypothetical protein KY333_02195 [Candidatus Woesearchaeota archaeon]|nr:hypothetical protein [Candidatus Woesearchaeota archaeon]MBW2994550.1 hypothetical protein [Candidatus Woesearchaeota archaeon]
MSEFFSALGLIAPYYNLILVVILFFLFLKLFATPTKNKSIFQLPWILIFVALVIFIIEELLTILRTAGLLDIPIHINGFFELSMIIIFIYTLFLQKEWIKRHGKINHKTKKAVHKSKKTSVKKKIGTSKKVPNSQNKSSAKIRKKKR